MGVNMQLKLQRSQREGGVVSKSVIFCLDARVEFTPAEQASITRYKLHKQVIYNSEAAQKHLASAGMSMATGNMIGSLYAYLDDLPDDLDRPFLYALHDFMDAETQMWALPAPDFERMSLPNPDII